MARFYLDHDFTHRVVGPLRRLGHTVITSEELGMGDAWDDEQLFMAVQQRAVLLSFNYRDFSLLHAAWCSWSERWGVDRRHYGIILPQQVLPTWPPEFLVQELQSVVASSDMENRFVEWKPSTGWRYLTPYRFLPDPDVTSDF